MRHASGTLAILLGLLITMGAGCLAWSQTDSASPPDTLETVLVTGEQPGPALWKVSKDGNVLWIVALMGPLSKKMTWRSRQVETILAEASELYTEPQFESYISSSREDGRLLDKAIRNDPGQTLQDVLSPEAYARFSAARQQYAGGGNRFEELRPFVAAQRLKETAMRTASLSGDGGVHRKLQSLARRNRVKVRSLRYVDNTAARQGVQGLDDIPRAADGPCLEAMVARLENDLAEAARLANAWAIGDVAELRRSFVPRTTILEACRLQISRLFMDGYAEANRRADVALRDALKRNRTTVALIPIESLFSADGILARFRRDAYQVEEPDQAER